jgi:hypothetical protein
MLGYGLSGRLARTLSVGGFHGLQVLLISGNLLIS